MPFFSPHGTLSVFKAIILFLDFFFYKFGSFPTNSEVTFLFFFENPVGDKPIKNQKIPIPQSTHMTFFYFNKKDPKSDTKMRKYVRKVEI